MFTIEDKIALSFKNQTYSYHSLSQHIYSYFSQFKSIKENARVLIFAENSPEWVFAMYGAWKNEGIAIPIDAQSTDEELAYIIKDAEPHIIFTSEEKREKVLKVLMHINEGITVLTPAEMEDENVDTHPVEDFMPKDEKKTALINYTSGTTGYSKGVMLSFKNLHFIVDAVSTEIEIFRNDRNVLMLLPVHHILPLMGSIVAPLYTGSTIYIAESLAPEVIVNTLKEGKISIIIGVPRLYETLAKGIMSKINAGFLTKTIYKMAKAIKSRSLSKTIFKSVHEKFGGHVRFMVSGGAALPTEIGDIFKTLGFEVLEGYGMTEMAPLISFTHPGKWHVGYSGYPLKGMDFKIEEGEVCVKGPNMMQGYYNRPEETDEALKDGWLHTGDLGFLDKKGLKLTGRKKELIVTSNGKKIDPVEIENEFYRLSAFVKEIGVFMHEDVLQAVILPDLKNIKNKSTEPVGEVMKSVVLRLNEKVAPYKRIKRYHLVSQELPKTRMGKIQRFKLHDLIVSNIEKPVQEEEKNYSEQYLLLRNFIESETDIKAGENAHFEIDLAMDSLSRVALLAYVEITFGVSLNEDNLNELNTLAKLNQYIEEHHQGIVQNKKMEWKDILTAKMANMTLPKSGFLNKTLNFIVKWLFRIVYRYQTHGVNNVPDEPCIMVANHQSMLDGMLITTNLKKRVNKKTYLFAKEKHWKSGIMSFMAKNNNVILMDINRNLKEGIQKLSYLLRNGKNVIIFPEGTRSKTGIRDFKEMFAILSKELNVPIVPVAINGSDRAMYKTIKAPRYLAPLSVDFLETIYPKMDESYHDLKERVKSAIAGKLKR